MEKEAQPETQQENKPSSSESHISLRDACKIAFWPFLLSRIWCALFVYIGHAIPPYRPEVIEHYRGIDHWWLNPWTAFDSFWFLQIARDGYNATSAAFFPLYPMALRLAGTNSITAALWGVLLSSACFFFGLVFFYRLTLQEYSPILARTALWLLAFFPTTAYFSAVYTDAMFLVFFVLCFWNVRCNRWAIAGVWALLAALTRNAAPLLFLGLLLEYLHARKTGNTPSQTPPKPLIATWAIAAPLLGFAIAQSYIISQVGDLTRSVTSQEEYFRALFFPLVPIWRDIMSIASGQINLITILHLGATLLAFIFVVRAWKSQPKSYGVMTIGLMLMHLTLGHAIPPYTLPAARYLSTMFPFMQRLAVEVQPLLANRFRLLIFVLFYGLISAVISFEFGQKNFVG